jgi:acetyltransferase-like isoleucine patch superfamily enzyme
MSTQTCSLTGKYEVGPGTYGNPVVRNWKDKPTATLKVGAYCSFAKEVQIFLGGNHRIDWISTYPFNSVLHKKSKGHPQSKGDVIIGNDVWIGWGATIMSGVTIGDGAVIGAEAVVAKDVAPYTVVVGNPACEVKKRFDDETIEYLLELKWWDWEEDKIMGADEILMSADFAKLKEYANE